MEREKTEREGKKKAREKEGERDDVNETYEMARREKKRKKLIKIKNGRGKREK